MLILMCRSTNSHPYQQGAQLHILIHPGIVRFSKACHLVSVKWGLPVFFVCIPLITGKISFWSLYALSR